MLDLTDLGHRDDGRTSRELGLGPHNHGAHVAPEVSGNLIAGNGARLFATDDRILQVDPHAYSQQAIRSRTLSNENDFRCPRLINDNPTVERATGNQHSRPVNQSEYYSETGPTNMPIANQS